ncbi:GNAT family N-acetyltransferase [Priestia flexa]|uniref:GNAT family N-acetyltransferase n=1 Tax=Priestia flexa TaxID=86664 RepID=UPI00389AD355
MRTATTLDYPELRFIYLESRSHHFHWMKAEAFQLEDFDRDMVGEHLLVAELDDKVVGFVSLYLPDNFIHCLFVHPDYSRKGVGTALVDASIQKMNTPLRLKCVSKNDKALLYYKKKGWVQVVEEGPVSERYWLMEYQ